MPVKEPPHGVSIVTEMAVKGHPATVVGGGGNVILADCVAA